MTPLVMDASAAAAFVLEAQNTPAAYELSLRWSEYDALTPYVFTLEVPWLLLKQERRRREPGLARAGLAFIDALNIRIEAAPDEIEREGALSLAISLHVGFYDAMYLLLAARAGALLATRDGGMVDIGRQHGVRVLDLR